MGVVRLLLKPSPKYTPHPILNHAPPNSGVFYFQYMKPKTEKNCKTCGKAFKPRTTLDRYCSFGCTPKKADSGANRISRSKLKPKSAKQAKLDRQYSAARKAFLAMPENKFCAVYPHKRATEVHHKKGRKGYADEKEIPLIVDVRYFLAVSREGHEFIENNPKEAYAKGWSLSRM